MTNLFDYLTNAGNALKDKVKTLDKGAGLSLYERMFGQAEKPTDSINLATENADLLKGVDTSTPEYQESMAGAETPVANITASQNPRKGGIFPDVMSGYKENRFTPVSINNFGQNTLEDGRKKGFAYKFGEGLGSLARFGESAPGRGLITAGLVSAFGGSPLEAVAYGGSAGALNQANRSADRLYRNSLEQQGIDTSNIRGYVNQDMYKNTTLANYRNNNLNMRQNIAAAKDNATRAKMILNSFESGMLSEDDAVNMLQHFGIDVNDLQPSNKSLEVGMKQELLPHQINILDARTHATYTNANNNTAKTQEYINYLRGGGRSGRTSSPITNNTGKVKMRYNGKIYNVDANRVKEYEQAGGVRV